MALEPFLINPPIRRRFRRSAIAFGLNPGMPKLSALRRRFLGRTRTARKNPFVRPLLVGDNGIISGLYSSRNPFKRASFKARKKRRATPAQRSNPMRKKRNRRGQFTRRNPVVLGNPRRKRSRSRRRNPVVLGNPRRRHRRNPIVLGNPHRRHRRHSYRRNPAIISKLGLPPAREILFLGLGAFAGRVLVPNVLARVPFLNSNPVIRAVSRLALVAVSGYAAKMVLKQNARMFTYGVLANQVPEVVNDLLSMTGMKLSDGNDDLGLYTGRDPYQSLPAAAPGLSLYTLNDGDGSNGVM